MADSPTGRQKDYALALGLRFSGEINSQDLSSMITEVMPTLDMPAVPAQRALANEWNLLIPEKANRRDASRILFGFLLARIWVYSVYRHLVAAKWRFHSECPLPPQAANWVAGWVFRNEQVFGAIDEKAPRTSYTCDAWFLIGPRTPETFEYRFVGQILQQHCGPYLSQAQGIVGADALAQQAPYMRAQCPHQDGGCLSVLITIGVLICGALVLMFGA